MNRALLMVGLGCMQACWIYPWSLLVTRWVDADAPRALLSPLSVVGLILLGALATRTIIRYLGTGRPGQVSLMLLGLVVVLLAVRLDQFPGGDSVAWLAVLASAAADLRLTAPVVALGLGLVLWWRGVQQPCGHGFFARTRTSGAYQFEKRTTTE